MNRPDTVQESTRKRRRWGCTCGCLFVFVCVAIVLTGLAIYAFREQQPSPKERWLTPSLVGFAVLRVNPDDSGITDMIRHQFKLIEEKEGPGMTERDRKNLHALAGAVQQFVTTFVHRDVFLFVYAEDRVQQPQWLCVMQFRRLASYLLVRAMIDSTGQPPSEKTGNATLYVSGSKEGGGASALGISRKTMMFASSAELLKKAMAPTAGKGTIALPPDNVMQYIDELQVEQPPEGEDIAGVALTKLMAEATKTEDIEQQLSEALKQARMSLSDVLAMSVTGDIASADKAKVSFGFHCRQPELARKLTEILKRQVVPQIDASRSSGSTVSAKADAHQTNSRAVLSVEFGGLKSIGKQPAEAKP